MKIFSRSLRVLPILMESGFRFRVVHDSGRKNGGHFPWNLYSPNKVLVGRFFVMGCLFALASCNIEKHKKIATINYRTKFSSSDYGVKGSPRVTVFKKVKKGGGRYQVGKPYKIRSKWYHPKEQPNYDKVGVASWYGPNFHGRLTANGEIYDQYALSAAHPTLPLPSYARVTNLENGSSVVVRINDRGPFSNKRIVDLSARASELLGYQKEGLAKVRVHYLGKARMDGLDGKYLMASYKKSKSWNSPPIFPVMTAFASNDSIPDKVAIMRVIRPPLPNASLAVASLGNGKKKKLTFQGSRSERTRDSVARNSLTGDSVTRDSMEHQLALYRAIPKPFQIAYMPMNMSEKFIVVAVNIPVPVVRPKSFHQELSTNLLSDKDMIIRQLDSSDYLNSDEYNQQVAQVLSIIQKR